MKKYFLLVDDDLIAQIVHKNSLMKDDRIIDEATSGIDAIKKFSDGKGKYNVVLMDYNMPDMDGVTTTKKIRAIEKKENYKQKAFIVGVTAHVDEDIKKSCLEAGMNSVVSKPIMPEDLEKLICQDVQR